MSSVAKHVEVHHQRPGRYTDIPAELIEWAEGRQECVHLGSAIPEVVGMRSALYRYPILAEELPGEVKKILVSRGFSIRADGTMERGDCILFKQALAAREAIRDEATEEWAAMDNPETIYEQMEEWNRKASGSGGRLDPEKSEVHPSARHARQGPSLLEEFRGR